ncbi:MAG: T9SS type A sorting domain-containing protein [Bacteroidales bacterium]|nr:T9SS type A sorting domain-containing protein [Bacteroidales bacterium]
MICFLFAKEITFSQTISASRYGASVAQWADGGEGWDNFPLLGVHYIRMPIDVSKGAIIDNFFLKTYDTLISRAQRHGLMVYAIINPRKNSGQFASTSEVAGAINSIVERYDGDGTGDLSGLLYPIKNWEVCNEVMYGTFANTPGTPGYPLWSSFTLTQYLDYMDTAKSVIKNTCADCNLFNGAQLLPPTDMFPSVCDLTAAIPTGNGPDIIDKISYHNYTQYFQIKKATEDFADCGIGDKPIWITEAGMQNEFIQDSSLTQEENAKRTVKSFAYVFTKGVERLIFTTMRAGVGDPESIQWESLLDPQTGAKKKVFWAYKKLIEKTDYFTSVDTITPHNDSTIFAIKFIVDGKPVYVLWADTNKTINIKVSGPLNGLFITNSVPDDTLGNFTTQYKTVSGNPVSIDISSEAIFVEEDLINANRNIETENFKVYPNPANDKLFIDNLNGNYENYIEIYSADGKLLLKQKTEKTNNEINIHHLSKGIYFLKLNNEKYSEVKSFVKD